MTSAGKLFNVRAAATENARSPMADVHVGGTSNAEDDDDRWRCRPGLLATGWKDINVHCIYKSNENQTNSCIIDNHTHTQKCIHHDVAAEATEYFQTKEIIGNIKRP